MFGIEIEIDKTMLKKVSIIKGGADKMNGLMKKLENVFVAATFAEAGEFETVKDILRENRRTEQDRISRHSKEVRAPGMRR
jgi:hypothetical protein